MLKKGGIEFQINTTITQVNLHLVPDILRLAVDTGAVAHHIFLLVPTGRGKELQDQEISALDYEKTLHWFYEQRDRVPLQLKATCAPHYYRILRQRAKKEGKKITPKEYGLDAMTRGCLGGISFCFISHVGSGSTLWLSRTRLRKRERNTFPEDLGRLRAFFKTSGIPTATEGNVEGVSSERSAEAAGPGLTRPQGTTWRRNLIASMSRFKDFFSFRISLTFQFILAMIVMMLIMSVGFGMFFLGREMTLLQSELKTKGETTSNAFSLLIESGIGLSDRPFLQRVAEKMVEDKDIFQCTLFDPQGERLAHVVREGGVPDSNFIYYLTQPVRSRDGHVIGSLEIGLSLRKLNREMEILKTEMLFLTMGMTGAGILLILILTRILFRPIRKLVTATERVGMGELVTVDIESRDEIGELAKAFNQMTLQLKDSRMDLEGRWRNGPGNWRKPTGN